MFLVSMHVLADVVRLVYLALVIFVTVTPFLDTEWHVDVLHLMTTIVLVSHWLMRQDACFFTLLEAFLRGVPVEHSFIYSIVGPVFNIDDSSLRRFVLIGTTALGFVSLSKIVKKWPTIKDDIRMSLERNGY